MSPTSKPRQAVWGSRSLIPIAIAVIASSLIFYVPVSVLFLSSRGISITEVFVLESVLVASILCTEIPAGLLGDRTDRRLIILFGFILNATADILFALGTNFPMYVVSFSLSGLSIAMLTGVQDAYIYDSLGDDADNKSVGVWGHLSSLSLMSGVFSSMIGGILASIDIALPAYVTAFMSIFAAVCVCFLPRQKSSYVAEDESPWESFKTGSRILLKSPLLIYIAIGSSASFVLFNAVYTLNQPIFVSQNIPVSLWGVVAGFAQILAAGYNYIADKIEQKVGRKNAFLLTMFYGSLGFFIMVIPNFLFSILGFLLVVLGMHSRGPIASAVTNKVVPNSYRATVLNVASSIGSLVGIAMNPLIGFGAEYSPVITLLIIGGTIFVLMLLWIPIAKSYL